MSDEFSNELSYERVDAALQRIQSPYEASEAHGIICGYLCCSRSQKNNDISFNLILGEGGTQENDHHIQQAHELLRGLYQKSAQQLVSMNFEFQLLLPDDQEDLRLRAKSLGAWCQGFHTGQSMAKLRIEEVDDGELRDALFHISEIAKLDYESLDISAADERSYMEVMEYVRVAVLMVHTQIQGISEAKAGSSQAPKGTLH